MAHAYTPGLMVSDRSPYRTRRMLPIRGEVLVQQGDHVTARQVVARAEMEGEITPVNIANMLALPPADVSDCMLKREGDRIDVGDSLARTPGIFGMFKRDLPSKVAGTLETISPVTGQIIIRGEPIPLEVLAFLTGQVAEVMPGEGCILESDATYVQGIFGVGGEAFGPLVQVCQSADEDLDPAKISAEMAGQIILGGARMNRAAFEQARDVGAAGIICGGMDDQDLKDILGYDLGVAITGSEQIGLTLVITEGFGSIAMAERTFEVLRSRAGSETAINGATQIRAGVMRPEIVIPFEDRQLPPEGDTDKVAGLLDIGKSLRAIREPWFGQIGKVSDLPSEPAVLESGSKARVLEVTFASGERAIIPRANVELIEE